MLTEFKSKLASVRASAERIFNNTNDVNTIKEESLKELSFYASAIPEFFSYNNEAVRIKNMYKKLKELDYTRNKVIPCINVKCASYIYREYLDGMINFIIDYHKKICCNSEDLPLMEKQLQTAIQGDPLFIDSLFGGKNNEITEEELTDAVSNVEFLVDFLEFLKYMENNIHQVYNHCCEQNSENTSITNCIRLIANSTCCFSNRIISAIMNIYEDINNTLDGNIKVSVDTSFKVF